MTNFLLVILNEVKDLFHKSTHRNKRCFATLSMTTFLIYSSLTSCSQTPAPPTVTPPPKRVYSSPVDILEELINAQDNFFRLSGRFSMTLDTLVEYDFLQEEGKKILNNEANTFPGWTFEPQLLPFPDEDVTWCYVGRGPSGKVLLAIFTGIWSRDDGNLDLSKENLPPKKPWARVGS